MNTNLFFKVGVFFTLYLLLANTSLFAQSCEELRRENEKLKSENERLKKQVEDLTNSGSSTDPKGKPKKGKESENTNVKGGQSNTVQTKSFGKYSVEYVSCIGDKSSQTVTIEFSVSHKLANQSFTIWNGGVGANGPLIIVAYGPKGEKYEIKEWGSGSTYHEIKIPTEVPVTCFLTFRNVLSNVNTLKFVSASCWSDNEDGGGNRQSGNIEFRNVPIEWR